MEYMNDALGCSTTKDLETAIVMGLMPGYSKVDKYGVNRNVTVVGTPEDVWEFGGDYVYDADGTAPIMYISSNNAADVDIEMEVQGLDIDGYFVSQTAILNGTANITLDTPLWRCYRAGNESDFPNYLTGTAFIHTDPAPVAGVPDDDKVRAIVNDVHGQTLMAVYTIPRGKVGFLKRGELGVSLEGNAGSLSEYAHCHYESRRFGKTFRVKKSVTCMIGGNAVYQDKRSFPDIVPAMSDMKLRVIDVTQDMGMWGTFDIMLVDEKYFPESYLKSIGQPGY